MLHIKVKDSYPVDNSSARKNEERKAEQKCERQSNSTHVYEKISMGIIICDILIRKLSKLKKTKTGTLAKNCLNGS